MHSALRSIALVLLLSCSHAPAATSAKERSAGSPELAQLVDDYFAARFAFAPSRGTGIGFHELDAQLEDLGKPRVFAHVAELKRFQPRLAAIDRSRLSFDDAIDAQLIENGIDAALLELTVVRG